MTLSLTDHHCGLQLCSFQMFDGIKRWRKMKVFLLIPKPVSGFIIGVTHFSSDSLIIQSGYLSIKKNSMEVVCFFSQDSRSGKNIWLYKLEYGWLFFGWDWVVKSFNLNWCGLLYCVQRYVWWSLNEENIWCLKIRNYHHCQGLPLWIWHEDLQNINGWRVSTSPFLTFDNIVYISSIQG